jgi:hypothetical protein
VRSGHGVEEIVRLIDLIHRGVVPRETRDHLPNRMIRPTTILLFGQSVPLSFDRDMLQRTFARPANWWDLLSSAVLAWLQAAFVVETRELNTLWWKI